MYNVYRYYQKSGRRKLILRCVTLEIAQLHCNSPLTQGNGWFDGFTKIP
jgi:hypothetical protein